ncbi:proclotting enzyme-like [Pollicipes pollicipes]|uniref:proclotting enzyme-like n=1 Tax=Pollicipes pollicipes TaxID=41117 RepID=UPI001885194E|nr:proclotting enzyme-like [Pollicipes pollicipes]
MASIADTCATPLARIKVAEAATLYHGKMLRLAVLCLALGVALAKPPPPTGRAGSESVPPPEPRLQESAPPPEPRHALPLPPPDSEDRATYSLQPGTYFITSPGYPGRYPNNAGFSYTLRGTRSQVLEISCSTFSVEGHSTCDYDYLSINNAKYCGNLGSINAVSGSTLQVVFRSDESVRRTGFYCLITVPEGGGPAATTPATTAATTAATTQAPSGGQCCGVPNRASRIVGGVQTEVNEYPWQAGLVSPGGTRTYCGGTVINNRYVLTAAHCTAGSSASRIQVLLREHRIGTSDGELRFSVSQIIDHPAYSSASSSGYDFSLLKLSTTINFSALNNKVAPACLPSSGDFVNVDAVVSGWGTTSSGGSQATALREVTVRTQSNNQCRQAYSTINDSMLCAGVSGGGKDSCQGDSGGPLVTLVGGRYNLIGVVSWGSGCALANYPGVYARVTYVKTWIDNNTRDASLC